MGSSSLRDDLEEKVVDLFDNELSTLPIKVSQDEGNIEVRIKWDGDNMLTFCEAKRVDIQPNEFRDYLVNFSEAFPKVNKMAQKIEDLDQDDRRVATKTFLKFPFPLSPRIMFHWRYLILDRNPDEHMLILSERGNEDMVAKHYTEKEKKRYVLGRTYLCSYWIKPVKENDKVVGSRILYVFSGDTGGSIPKFVENTVGPQTAYDSVHGLINYLSKK